MTGAALPKKKRNLKWVTVIKEEKSNYYEWVLQHTLFRWNASISAPLIDDRAALPKNKREMKGE